MWFVNSRNVETVKPWYIIEKRKWTAQNRQRMNSTSSGNSGFTIYSAVLQSQLKSFSRKSLSSKSFQNQRENKKRFFPSLKRILFCLYYNVWQPGSIRYFRPFRIYRGIQHFVFVILSSIMFSIQISLGLRFLP